MNNVIAVKVVPGALLCRMCGRALISFERDEKTDERKVSISLDADEETARPGVRCPSCGGCPVCGGS